LFWRTIIIIYIITASVHIYNADSFIFLIKAEMKRGNRLTCWI